MTCVGTIRPQMRKRELHFIRPCACCMSSSTERTLLRQTAERIHKSVPVGLLAVTASVLVSVPGLVPPALATGAIFTIFGSVGLAGLVHIDHPLDVHALMTAAAFAALAIGQGAEGAFLLSLFQLAHAVQKRVFAKAEKNVDELVRIVPESVRLVLPNGEISQVNPQTVTVGSRIVVLPHSVVPIDGVLMGANSISVQLAHITGEAAVIDKSPSDPIPAGAVNTSAHAIEIETTKLATESTLQRIVALTQQAARSRPTVASIIDQVAPRYSAAVLAGTACIALGGPALSSLSYVASAYMALSFLVAASPCALLVAAPVAQAAAVSALSKRGVILSGGAKALERFAFADSLVVDKTGTVTEGRLRPTSVSSTIGDGELAMSLGGVLGRFGSSHPVAQGIGSAITGPTINRFRLDPASVTETPGVSVSGAVRDLETGKQFLVTISKAHGFLGQTQSQITATSDRENHSVIVSLEDRVRDKLSSSLAKSSLPVFMLTGDNEEAAQEVAKRIGLSPTNVFASMSPEMKAQFVQKLSFPVMVGDGVNDAPALAAAKAGGVAVASSVSGESIKSAAVSVADAVVIADSHTDPVGSALFLVAKSKQTDRLVKQNLVIGLGGMIGTAAAVLSGTCPLWLAVILHEGSTVLVVLNSLRNL